MLGRCFEHCPLSHREDDAEAAAVVVAVGDCVAAAAVGDDDGGGDRSSVRQLTPTEREVDYSGLETRSREAENCCSSVLGAVPI